MGSRRGTRRRLAFWLSAAASFLALSGAACSLGFDGDEFFRSNASSSPDSSDGSKPDSEQTADAVTGGDGSPIPRVDGGSGGDSGACVDMQSNPLHCGRCNHSCFGGACAAGLCKPTVIVDSVAGAMGVVAVGDKIYFGGNGRIRRADADGKNAMEVVSTANARYMAASATHIYWADTSTGGIQRWAIGAAPGARETVVNGVTSVSGVALGPTHVYFSRYTDNGSVERVLYDGGSREAILSPYNHPEDVDFSTATNELIVGGDGEDEIAAHGEAGFGVRRLLINGAGPVSMALDGSDLLFVQQADETIQRVPFAGGQKQFLASAGGLPCGITSSTDSIYWANCAGGEIMRLAK